MKFVRAVIASMALFAASPGIAQEATGTGEMLAQVPQTLGGVAVAKMPGDILMYFLTGPSGEPMVVGVMIGEMDAVRSSDELQSGARKMAAGKTRIRKTLREGAFTTPKWPGATTFFGDYETGKFSHQIWIAAVGRNAITVLATYDKKKDAAQLEALVRNEIFGGAVVQAAAK